MARLILDTSVVVDAERRGAAARDLSNRHEPDATDLAISAVTVAEMRLGIELATNDAHRTLREAYVADLLATIPVEVYDADVAVAHARLLAHVRRTGRPRGAHDLIVAATAAATDRTVLTADRRGFVDLPGVKVRQVGDG